MITRIERSQGKIVKVYDDRFRDFPAYSREEDGPLYYESVLHEKGLRDSDEAYVLFQECPRLFQEQSTAELEREIVRLRCLRTFQGLKSDVTVPRRRPGPRSEKMDKIRKSYHAKFADMALDTQGLASMLSSDALGTKSHEKPDRAVIKFLSRMRKTQQN